ncbi:hypothetical protein B0D95_18345 [Cellvibrio sp. PSBB023]|nr:hypothetical protein B0D95_18345 [Cellvibrio sp. PSBB023]
MSHNAGVGGSSPPLATIFDKASLVKTSLAFLLPAPPPRHQNQQPKSSALINLTPPTLMDKTPPST